MPSPRKRIGFLPGVETQEIIDKICAEEKLSQSKVTGLLVEESLKRRGLYKPKKDKKQYLNTLTEVIFSENYQSEKLSTNNSNSIGQISNEEIDNERFEKDYYINKAEFELLKDFIEYKRFKFMMQKARDEGFI
tara:strand:- start:9956 stop:10357 length:402 start_codon:yes stop_codon:yes gene_type:complete